MDWNARIGKRIKLRDLHVLEATIEAGSMAKAASELAISQPAVSYAIAELEHAFGVPLLERRAQGVVPTPYGLALVARSRAAFNELRQGVEEIASLADPSVGELRIGTTPPMSAIASAVFNGLLPAYPRIGYHLDIGGTAALLSSLRQRDIELVISRLADFERDKDLEIDTLFHDELSVICSRQNPWARKRRVSLKDLVEEPWVFPNEKGFLTKIIAVAFEEHGLAMPKPAVTTQSTYSLSVLVANGPFLGMHPGTMLTTPRPHPQLTRVNVRLRSTLGAIGLIALKGRPLSPAAALFRRATLDIAKKIPKPASSPKPR